MSGHLLSILEHVSMGVITECIVNYVFLRTSFESEFPVVFLVNDNFFVNQLCVCLTKCWI